MVEVLFIGGPKDGEIVPVSQHLLNLGRMEVVHMPDVPIHRPDLLSDKVEAATYRFHKVDMFRERYFVAVEASVTNPLHLLIKGYKARD